MELNPAVHIFTSDIKAYAAAKWAPDGAERPHGRWLTMTPESGACMFCTTPEGYCNHVLFNPYIYDNRTGYLTCSKEACLDKANKLISSAPP